MSKTQIKEIVKTAIPKDLTKVNINALKGEVLKQLTTQGIRRELAQSVIDETIKPAGVLERLKPIPNFSETPILPVSLSAPNCTSKSCR